MAAQVAEPQIQATVAYLRAIVALVDGRFEDSRTAALDAVEAWHDTAPLVLPWALRAAAYSGNLAGAHDAGRLLDEHPSTGALARTGQLGGAAIVAALEGRTQDAVNEFRAAIELMHQMGMEFSAALLTVDALKLLPDQDPPRQWAVDARALFERLDATACLALLNESLSASIAGSSTPTAKTTSDAAVPTG
ncbi:MAG: hypothetical protein ACR2H0_02290 [Candidatus Limnocylindrales bacterium]